tara:strand:- start:1162 stop:1653 length:492 start_codon:yes stop_codon:yes gene_type:complete
MKIKNIFYCLLFSVSFVNAQVAEDNILFIQLQKMDNIVFEEGFNKCNLVKLEKTLHSEIEFYHDIGGMQNKEDFMKNMKSNICSSPERKPIRKVVEGSIQVFPLYNQGILYGAIQNGSHEFWLKEPNKDLYQTGLAKFSTTWLLVDGEWKMKNVLSFDHSAVH